MLWVRIDRARKLPITVLLRALGYGSDADIVGLLGEDERLLATIERSDSTVSIQEDLSYRSIADREDRALEDGATVMEYVQ